MIGPDGKLLGVITRRNLLEDWVTPSLHAAEDDGSATNFLIAYDLIHRDAITIYPWESCRTAAERMAAFGVGRLPMLSPDE